MTRLIHLFLVFSLLSVLAVGGGTAVLPEMQHMTVHTFHWLTDAQFRNIYSLGQVAPGPNMLMVLVIGYQLAGWAGMVVVGIAIFPARLHHHAVRQSMVGASGRMAVAHLDSARAGAGCDRADDLGDLRDREAFDHGRADAGDRARGVRHPALAPRQSGRAGAGGRSGVHGVEIARCSGCGNAEPEPASLARSCPRSFLPLALLASSG